MPKRKRESPSTTSSDEDIADNRALTRQRKLCSQRLESSQKALVSALRLGAGFERQKYSRRRKSAKANNDEKATVRLDAEYKVLKELDFAKIAESHLRKTVLKVKSLQASEALPDTWRVAGEKEKQSPEALNVTARLYKVKGVKEEVDQTIEDLKGVLGVGGVAQTDKKRKGDKEDKKAKKKAKNEDVDEEEDWSGDELEMMKAFGGRIAAASSDEGESDDSLSEGERPPSVEDSEEEWSGIKDDSDGSLPDADHAIDDSASTSEESSASEEGHASESDDSVESSDVSIQAPKTKSKPKPAEKSHKSTFIPSLSAAGYISGSESEASDLDDVAPKKNRRGQRARQKIWEQKYGDKAKHVQKEDRNQGWDAKKGAVDTTADGERAKTPRKRAGRRGPLSSGENAVPLGKARVFGQGKRDDAGSLHPSWAAAKAAKEKKIDMKPQGKKVVFD